MVAVMAVSVQPWRRQCALGHTAPAGFAHAARLRTADADPSRAPSPVGAVVSLVIRRLVTVRSRAPKARSCTILSVVRLAGADHVPCE
jgi:hypothetical protein